MQSEIVGCCISQFHDDENSFELLLAYADGREVGHVLSRTSGQNLAEEFTKAFPAALVDVPAIEPVGDDLIGYVLRYGGMCRDCADMDGVCQSGQPCDTDQRRAVVKHTVAALAYGIKRGFIANPFTSPPLTREGEDSAEVGRLTRPIVGIEHRTAQEVFDIMADRIRLAATRSGSATDQKGCAE